MTDVAGLRAAIEQLDRILVVIDGPEGPALGVDGELAFRRPRAGEFDARAYVPSVLPRDLGDPNFTRTHELKAPYVAGSMANGIASVELVTALSRAGYLSFFGAAGLAVEAVAGAVAELKRALRERSWGVNLIHSPYESGAEAAVVDLCLAQDVRRIEVSAFTDLTLDVVRYRVAGLAQAPDGSVQSQTHIVAKVSRAEIAARFLAPAPAHLLAELLGRGAVTQEQCAMASRVAVAQDVTVEADSGGHTDNRPLVTLLPSILALRDELAARHGLLAAPRIGAAGGIATPAAAYAAFALGAAYVMTGSVNQACIESGSSDRARQMLAQASQSDVAMAPAADMFEMGVKLQVLRKGTMFASRSRKLWDLYQAHASLDEISASDRSALEQTILRRSIAQVWEDTAAFWKQRDPAQHERALREPKHKMALVFRWYLGMSSRWANRGEPGRELDYQVWCGPSMGAFNDWARGSELEQPAARRASLVAANLMVGAATLARAHALALQGWPLPASILQPRPRTDSDLLAWL